MMWLSQFDSGFVLPEPPSKRHLRYRSQDVRVFHALPLSLRPRSSCSKGFSPTPR